MIEHADGDHTDDRYHAGADLHVPLRVLPAAHMSDDTWKPGTLAIYLTQDWRGGPVMVHLYSDNFDKIGGRLDQGVDLFLAEAELLIAALGDVVKQAAK